MTLTEQDYREIAKMAFLESSEYDFYGDGDDFAFDDEIEFYKEGEAEDNTLVIHYHVYDSYTAGYDETCGGHYVELENVELEVTKVECFDEDGNLTDHNFDEKKFMDIVYKEGQYS